MIKLENKKLYRILKMLETWEKGQNFEKVNGTVDQLTRDTNEYYYLLGKKSLLDSLYYTILKELKENL